MKSDAEPAIAKETDPRWKSLPPSFIRASETPLPLPLGHFLRQFGQSDRREIDAFNRDPNTTHSLALMNGDLTSQILEGRFAAASSACGQQSDGRCAHAAHLPRDPRPLGDGGGDSRRWLR